jgi:hypothetical protein
MATARAHSRFPQQPDVIWALVSDPMAITKWGQGIAEATWDTDTRTVTLESGVSVRERVVTVDNGLRRFQYEVLPDEGTGIERHLATVDVLDDPAGSLVMWSVDVKPDSAGRYMQKVAVGCLEALAAYFAAGAAGNAVPEPAK